MSATVGPRFSMMRRIIGRSLHMRRGRTFTALAALTLSATLITAMLSLYSDLERKLDKEFRSYGANIIVAATEGHTLPDGAAQSAQQILRGRALIVPSGLVVATAATKDGRQVPVVVAGVDLSTAKKLNSWWKLDEVKSQTADGAPRALMGLRAFKTIDSSRGLTFHGRILPFAPAETVQSGGPEEDRIYIELPEFEHWTGTRSTLLEVAYTGSSAETEGALRTLEAEFAGEHIEVRPVRNIVEAEGRVIRKTRSMMLACGLLISITVVLCVGSTLTASVLERRRDFALMKALGASQRLINVLFTAEAALLGTAAAIAGFIAGSGLADLIGTVNFHSSITPHALVLPSVVIITVIVALASAILPLARLQRLEPAVILKGD